MFTDSFFAYGNELFLQHHVSYSSANTFQYRFSYHVSNARRHKLTFTLFTASLLLQCRASTTEWRRPGCTATTAPPSPTVTSSTSSGIHSGTRHHRTDCPPVECCSAGLPTGQPGQRDVLAADLHVDKLCQVRGPQHAAAAGDLHKLGAPDSGEQTVSQVIPCLPVEFGGAVGTCGWGGRADWRWSSGRTIWSDSSSGKTLASFTTTHLASPSTPIKTENISTAVFYGRVVLDTY